MEEHYLLCRNLAGPGLGINSPLSSQGPLSSGHQAAIKTSECSDLTHASGRPVSFTKYSDQTGRGQVTHDIYIIEPGKEKFS